MGGGNSLDFARELGTCKGFRWENQSLPGPGFNASLCRFNFETVSIYGNFIFVAPSSLRRISFCYDNTHLGLVFFIHRKGANIPVLRVV